MKHFYAVEFLGGNRTCTSGTPNAKTGRYSIAIDYKIFNTKTDRNAWVEEYNTSERLAVTKKDLRTLQLGQTIQEFNDNIEM